MQGRIASALAKKLKKDNNYKKILNEAQDFKNAPPEMDDLTLFFEFGTFDLLKNYNKQIWGFIY